MFGVRSAAWLLLASCVLTAAVAETASGSFGIRVILQAPSSLPGIAVAGSRGADERQAVCAGETQELGAGALVQVLCTVGPFVSIQPMPGQVREVEAGQTFRYQVGPGAPMRGVLAGSTALDAGNPVGMVTALQVSNATGHSSAIEMLVSF